MWYIFSLPLWQLYPHSRVMAEVFICYYNTLLHKIYLFNAQPLWLTMWYVTHFLQCSVYARKLNNGYAYIFHNKILTILLFLMPKICICMTKFCHLQHRFQKSFIMDDILLQDFMVQVLRVQHLKHRLPIWKWRRLPSYDKGGTQHRINGIPGVMPFQMLIWDHFYFFPPFTHIHMFFLNPIRKQIQN